MLHKHSNTAGVIFIRCRHGCIDLEWSLDAMVNTQQELKKPISEMRSKYQVQQIDDCRKDTTKRFGVMRRPQTYLNNLKKAFLNPPLALMMFKPVVIRLNGKMLLILTKYEDVRKKLELHGLDFKIYYQSYRYQCQAINQLTFPVLFVLVSR